MNRNKKRIDWIETKRRIAMSQETIAKGSVLSDQRTHKIFQQRSLELARRLKCKQTEATCRTLVIALGTERYCLELASLREVLPLGNCTPVPGGPRELVGLINQRGEIRPVICLSRLMGLDGVEPDKQVGGYIAMIGNGLVELGLRVDAVERVAIISTDSLNLPDNDGAGLSDGYVRGVTPDGLIVLNLSAILSHPVFLGHYLEDKSNGTA